MTLLRLFLSMLLVGAVSFGGGYGILPLLQYQLVGRLRIVTVSEFADAIAVGQFTPGPILIMVAFIGYRAAGWPGALVSVTGLFIPAFVAVLALSSAYERIHGNPSVERAAAGINAVVVGLLAAAIIGLVPGAGVVFPTLAMATAVCALTLTTKIEPAVLVLACGAIGYVVFG